MTLENKIKEQLSKIAFGDSNLLEADIIESFMLEGKNVTIKVEKDLLSENVKFPETELKNTLENLEEIDHIDIVYIRSDQKNSEQQGPVMANNQYLPDYRYIIAVGSGKGGVGKSTVSLNLALSLHRSGLSVSLFDADIYGPSIPLMLGERGKQPRILGRDIIPLEKYGLTFMSIGNLISEQESVIWRGPMVHQAVDQILRDTAWPGGDVFIIDLPPGTGDVQISISQLVSLNGAVIVSTPQDLALLDARRAMRMFEKVNVPVLGMIENMSSFLCPHCGKESEIFGKGGVENESKEYEVPFLGEIPIDPRLMIQSDKGEPLVHSMPESNTAKIYTTIAENLMKTLTQ